MEAAAASPCPDDAAAGLRARELGVHRLALPSPMVGVNCWLIDDDPLTLVDCGLNWGGALDALEGGLRALGVALERIELIVLTHQHVDHVGLAELVARRSGAPIACHARLARWLEALPEALVADDELIARRLAVHGAPAPVVAAYRARMEMLRMLGSRPRPELIVGEGETLPLRDRALRAILRPGHSPTDTVFVDEAQGLAFVGDHVMAQARTTPYLDPDAGEGWEADLAPARALGRSLALTAAAWPDAIGLPGHGTAFAPVGAVAAAALASRRRRARRLLAHLDATPRTAWELVERAYPALTPARAFLGLLEVLAQLAELLDAGCATALPEQRRCRFTRAAG